MYYSNFNGIIHLTIDIDADVVTIENSKLDEKLRSICCKGVKYDVSMGLGGIGA